MIVPGRKWLIRAAVALAVLWAIFVYRNRRGSLSITFQGVETNRTGEVVHLFKVQNNLADIQISPFILTAGGEEFGIGDRVTIFQEQKNFQAARYEIRGDLVRYHRVRYFTLSPAKIETSGGPSLPRGQSVMLRCSQPVQPVSWVAGIWYSEPATPHRDRLAIWNSWLASKFGAPTVVHSKARNGQLMSDIIAWHPLLPWPPPASTNILPSAELPLTAK